MSEVTNQDIENAYRELKEKHPHLSTFKIKRSLRYMFQLSRKELDKFDFFRLPRNYKQRQGCAVHFIKQAARKKVTKMLHYDPHNIITKYVLASGAIYNSSDMQRPIVNIMYKSHHKVSYD